MKMKICCTNTREHCGKKNSACAELKVHTEKMHETHEDKYLGDQIHKSAKHASTVSKRRAKGFGIISDIMQILDIIQDSETRIRVGLTLRQVWFINALCVNVEAWHNILQKDIEVFQKLDHYLMRKIIGAHSKVPIESLYLETASIPIEFIIASRRVNYLHNIVSRDRGELVKRVYTEQKTNPSKGDWCHMVQSDMAMIGLNMSETQISITPKHHFKLLVKRCVKNAAFSALQKTKLSHTKVKNIEYPDFKLQPYMHSRQLSKDQVSTLFNLRADTVNGYKECFPHAYVDLLCKLGCNESDSISHMFKCSKIDEQCGKTLVQKDAIFANIEQQKDAVSTFTKRDITRAAIIKDAAASQGQSQILDTSTPAAAGGAGATTGMQL
jgi:hypothetical protein